MSGFEMDPAQRHMDELLPPTIDKFDVLKDMFLEIVNGQGVQLYMKNENNTRATFERQYRADEWSRDPEIIISLTGWLSIDKPNQDEVLQFLYREAVPHPETGANSSIHHKYILNVKKGQIFESTQSISVVPQIKELTVDLTRPEAHVMQAINAREILKREVGREVPLTNGDCGVLLDRLMLFQQHTL